MPQNIPKVLKAKPLLCKKVKG